MERKPQRWEREKKSSIKLIDLFTGAGITTLIGPAEGLTYKALTILFEYTQNLIKSRNDARCKLFHETLVKGDLGEDEVENFLEKDIDLEEYYALLRAAIQDDEDKKTYHYAELLRKLALNQVSEEYKPYLMRIVRELAASEIELVRQIYIHENYDLIPEKGPSEQLSNLLSNKNLTTKLAIDSLLRLGLIERDNQNNFKPTDLIPSTAKAFFKSSDLTPNSIERSVWRKERLLIVSFQEEECLDLASRIQKLLREQRFQPLPIALFHPELSRNLSLIGISVLILVIGKTEHARFFTVKEVDTIAKTVKIPNSVKVIKIIVKIDDFSSDDFLPSIQADKVIYCSLDEVTKLQTLDILVNDLIGSK